jgi:hypothetical protein
MIMLFVPFFPFLLNEEAGITARMVMPGRPAAVSLLADNRLPCPQGLSTAVADEVQASLLQLLLYGF